MQTNMLNNMVITWVNLEVDAARNEDSIPKYEEPSVA